MKHWIYICILNAVALIIWSFQLYQIGLPGQELMMNNLDAPEYVAVGHWLLGGTFTHFIDRRTFLFPLWLTSITGVFGLKGFFVSQSLLWLTSVNLLHQALMKLRLPQLISLVAGLIFCFNLTILSISYEVMTETFTVFLCCLYVYLIMNCKNVKQLKGQLGTLLFISVLLMLLKPIFESLFILLASYIIFLFKEKNSGEHKKKLRWLLISLIPVSVQLFIMLRYVGVFSLSGIADFNLRNYWLAQALGGVEHIDIHPAREIVSHWSLYQIIQFAAAHPVELGRYYFQNLHFNVSTFPNETSAIGSPALELNFMIWWNRFHWLAQLALPLLLAFSWKKIREQSLDVFRVILLALPMYDVLLLSSVSFGQGDRLILPAIPFAVGLYGILVKVYFPRVTVLK